MFQPILLIWFSLFCIFLSDFNVQTLKLNSQIKLRKDKPSVRQANMPSTIVIAMDIPAFGLK